MQPKLIFRRTSLRISEGFSNWYYQEATFSQSDSDPEGFFENTVLVGKIFDVKKIWFRYRYPVMT